MRDFEEVQGTKDTKSEQYEQAKPKIATGMQGKVSDPTAQYIVPLSQDEAGTASGGISEDEQPKESQDNLGDWTDHGIVDVPVADLPWPENVNGSEDFNPNKLSYEDAHQATKRYEDMKPLIDRGYKGEDFSQFDKDQGLPYSEGQRRVYDLFHGSQPIKVGKIDEQYFIDGGNHRVYMAKKLGLKRIPARLKEKLP